MLPLDSTAAVGSFLHGAVSDAGEQEHLVEEAPELGVERHLLPVRLVGDAGQRLQVLGIHQRRRRRRLPGDVLAR